MSIEQEKPGSDTMILEDTPAIMRRPMALIKGKGYAATWVYIKHKNETKLELVVISDNRKLYTDAPLPNANELDDLPIELDLPVSIDSRHAWSGSGLNRYISGKNPSASKVFEQVKLSVNHFMDFEHSFGSQDELAELSACYAMATYFMDAFSVTGYLWPNGEAGSGKSHYLYTMSELAYLGEVILASSSMATQRDMASYGATLCFDDAEKIMDSKGDPDKQALLLAGNRKGTTVMVKEPAGSGKGWVTKRISAFCPKLFSAIRLPTDTLSSRTIIIPLLASDDPEKTTSDPLDHEQWPDGIDHKILIDDLWSMTLSNIASMPAHDRKAALLAPFHGRPFQPWRAIHAIALWLDANGTTGLHSRMVNLSKAYRKETIVTGGSNVLQLVIISLRTVLANQFVANPKAKRYTIATHDIYNAVNDLAKERDLCGINDEYNSSLSLGWKLKRLRLEKPESRKSNVREWLITKGELERLERTNGINVQDDKPHNINVTNVRNVINDTNQQLNNDVSGASDGSDVLSERFSNDNPTGYAADMETII